MSRLTKPRHPEDFPNRGQWGEGDYLRLHTNHLVELSDGFVEVLPMPTMPHQLIVHFLGNLFLAFVSAGRMGTVLLAPFRVRLWDGKYREPDISIMLAKHAPRMTRDYWEGADLAAEVVSEDDPDRDTVIKREEYARAGIRRHGTAFRSPRPNVFCRPGPRRASARSQGTPGEGTRPTKNRRPGAARGLERPARQGYERDLAVAYLHPRALPFLASWLPERLSFRV